MRIYTHRSFNGRALYREAQPLREVLLAQMLPDTETTAWAMAKKLDALGSTVSSLMYKLWQQGRLERGERTKHKGWHYSLSRQEIENQIPADYAERHQSCGR